MIDTGRVVIAGCGYVGAELAERLARKGAEVVGLRRSGGPSRAFPSGGSIHYAEADLTKPRSLVHGADGVELAVFAASADASTDDAYRRTYVEGLRHFLDALVLARAPVRRLVFVSSTSVYADHDGAWVDEDTPANASHFTGARTLEAEAIALASPCSSVILRLGGIYGPGRARMVESVARGEAKRTGGPERVVNRIHRNDAAGALAHLLTLEDPERIYLGVDDEPACTNSVITFIARAMALPEPPLTSDEHAPQGGHGGHKRCRNTRLVASGYRFQFPTYREGYGALVHASRSVASAAS